jgi:maleylpyruvate isomerase
VAVTITDEGYPDDLVLTTRWMTEGTAFLLDTLTHVDDSALDEPSALPGWQRRHVCAHLARNAEALGRLLTWAATGIETPMYVSDEARDADIAASALAPADALRSDVMSASQALLDQAAALQPEAWSSIVATRRGQVPASIVPWLRTREVWIHAVDLDAGATFADIPDEVCESLITELVTGLNRRGGTALTLVAGEHEWIVGAGTTTVAASPAELAAWLTGRVTRPEATLPPWI